MSDIRTALTEAIAKTEEGDTASTESQQFDAAPEQVEAAPEIEAPTQSERARDQQGRFAKQQAERAAEKASVEASVAPQKKRAPSSWKKDIAERWDGLDPTIQDEILRRESDYHAGYNRVKPMIQQAEGFQRALAPYEQHIRANGIDPVQAVARLAKIDHDLRTGTPQQKMDIVRLVMRTAGINPDEIFGEAPQPDPVQQAIQPLMAQINELKEAENRRDQQEANRAVESFNQDKPHFDAVRGRMADLIEFHAMRGEQLSLDDAYEMAIWENPEIRQQLIQERTNAAAEEARRNQQRTRAKTAAAMVNGAPNGTPSDVNRPKSIREALQEAARQHRA